VHTIKTCGKVESKLHSFLNSTLNRGEELHAAVILPLENGPQYPFVYLEALHIIGAGKLRLV